MDNYFVITRKFQLLGCGNNVVMMRDVALPIIPPINSNKLPGSPRFIGTRKVAWNDVG
jgi:hypothetical protein